MSTRQHLLYKWRRPLRPQEFPPDAPFPAKLLAFDTKDQVFFQMHEKARELSITPPRRGSHHDPSNPGRIEWDDDGWHHTWEYAGVRIT